MMGGITVSAHCFACAVRYSSRKSNLNFFPSHFSKKASSLEVKSTCLFFSLLPSRNITSKTTFCSASKCSPWKCSKVRSRRRAAIPKSSSSLPQETCCLDAEEGWRGEFLWADEFLGSSWPLGMGRLSGVSTSSMTILLLFLLLVTTGSSSIFVWDVFAGMRLLQSFLGGALIASLAFLACSAMMTCCTVMV